MARIQVWLPLALVLVLGSLAMWAQQSVDNTVVPQLVKFSGVLLDGTGKPLTGIVGVTFSLYKDQQGGAALWMETQNVQPDNTGHYSVMLGSGSRQGLSTDLFTAGEPRWVSFQAQGEAEQPRVMLVSVPYAMKAGDAQTVGGLPASAFVLAVPSTDDGSRPTSVARSTSTGSVLPPGTITGSGSAGFLPDFTGTATIGNSAVFQSGASPTAKIGINTNAPATNLDVNGGAAVRGTFSLPATGTATATTGKNSQPENLAASAFDSGTKTAITETFQLKAEPVGNNTTTASGSLNLLFGQGTSAPAETGFKISSKGILTFATGQAFPGVGTVTSVGNRAGLIGGPITKTGTLSIATGGVTNTMLAHSALTVGAGTGLTGGGSVSLGGTTTLNLDTTKVPTLGASNSFTAPNSFSGSNTSSVVGVNNSGSGDGIDAFSTFGDAIYGQSTSGPGVFAMSTTLEGVYGESSYYIGVFGQTVGSSVAGIMGLNTRFSATGGGFNNVGTWGDTGISGGIGVLGTEDDGNALFGKNNTVHHETLYAENDSGFNGGTPLAARFAGPNATTYCYIQRDSLDNGTGDLVCTGTKSAAVPVEGNRMVRLYAVEAADNWFEDAGSGRLANGSATVTLDFVFAQTVNGGLEYHVCLTPNGECEGLYVTNKTSHGFDIHELHGGHTNVALDYRVMLRRKGFENVRMQDVTADFAKMKRQSDLLAARLEAGKAAEKARPKPRIPTLPK